jgi:hypothetical protein
MKGFDPLLALSPEPRKWNRLLMILRLVFQSKVPIDADPKQQ